MLFTHGSSTEVTKRLLAAGQLVNNAGGGEQVGSCRQARAVEQLRGGMGRGPSPDTIAAEPCQAIERGRKAWCGSNTARWPPRAFRCLPWPPSLGWWMTGTARYPPLRGEPRVRLPLPPCQGVRYATRSAALGRLSDTADERGTCLDSITSRDFSGIGSKPVSRSLQKASLIRHFGNDMNPSSSNTYQLCSLI